MDKRKILIQLDSDVHPSVFDRVVATDAGADVIFSYGSVKPEHVRDLIHGAIFTRKDLKNTALFIGGSDVVAAEILLSEALKHMIPQFGLRVSVLLDANGANTTAAAAVRVAGRHLDLKATKALVLGGTGPVGQRVALLLAREGAEVRVSSRQQTRASAICDKLRSRIHHAKVEAAAISNAAELTAALTERTLVVAAGAAGVVLLPAAARAACKTLRMAIDLNAVPPLGVEGAQVTDKGMERDGVVFYGAIGVGDTKMKIHKAAVAKLFESNDQVLDAEQVYAIGEKM